MCRALCWGEHLDPVILPASRQVVWCPGLSVDGVAEQGVPREKAGSFGLRKPGVWCSARPLRGVSGLDPLHI